MKPKALEHLIYTLVIVLSLIILGLMAFAPDFMNSQVVYQGF
jgi:hypothetical protein